MNTSFRSFRRRAGFTLVELLVAVGLFAVIMTLSAGAYLVMIAVNARAQAVALVTDELSFVLENITRSIRTGRDYSCSTGFDSTNCQATGGSSFTFNSSSNDLTQYRVSSGAIERYTTITGWVPLTDPGITITSLVFYVSGAGDTSGGNYAQPFVRIVVIGTARAEKGETVTFSVETAATMRGVDI